MDQNQLETTLSDLKISNIRYYETIGSTNEYAGRWAEMGAPNLSLVVADEQTAGRGRLGRSWYSPAGASLSFSLVLRSVDQDVRILSRLSALGALAVSEAIEHLYSLPTEIKWPNDVLLNRRKVCGILPEVLWSGNEVSAVILGIGINVGAAAVQQNATPKTEFLFPATSIEHNLEHAPDRTILLKAVLKSLLSWRSRLASHEFMQAWEARLAYKGEWVQITQGENLPGVNDKQAPVYQEGKVLGLGSDGSLRLLDHNDETLVVRIGEVRLRPLN